MTGRRFEDEVEALLAEAYRVAFRHKPSEEWLTAIAMRAGTRGPVATLDEAGKAIGVTRERIRQVMVRVSKHLVGKVLPGTKDLVETLVERSPVAEPVGVRLAHSGRTRATLTGAGLLNILSLLGTSPRKLVGTDLVCVDGWLVEESEVPLTKSISMASRHTSAYGMTTVEEIRQSLATADKELDPIEIRRVLKGQRNVRWAGEWLWVDKEYDGLHSNRLVNTARSILSVNSPQTVISIHQGCRRMWKFRQIDILPPVLAMKTFFESSPYFTVTGDLVAPIAPLDYHNILGTKTTAMIEVLKSQPHQIMDRRTLQESCEDAGIAKGTYGVWTTFAEWMEKFGPNVWGLRGANPNPAVIDAVRDAARKRSKSEPRRKKWRWADDGRALQIMDVSTNFLNTGVMSFVPEVHDLLAGQAVEIRHNGRRVGIVKIGQDHSFSWGWTPVLKGIKAEHGQVMRISVDVSTRTAEVAIGGEELWS